MRSVSVEVHTLSGYVYAFNDAASPSSGSTALAQIGSDSMIHAIGTDTDGEVNLQEIYIPFHAINYAVVTVDNSLTAPSDDLCKRAASCSDYHYYTLNMQQEVSGLSDTVTMSEARMIVFCSTQVIPDGPAPVNPDGLGAADVTGESSAPDIISISLVPGTTNLLMVTANSSGTATLTLTTADGCVKEITVVRA